MSEKPVFKSPVGRRKILDVYDEVLARWPVPYQELDVDTPLGITHVIASGEAEAPALILLHGSSVNASMWIGDVATHSRCFRVYAVDIPGEAGKSAAVRPPLQSEAYTVWLRETLLALGVQRARLEGISLGAWIALKYATAYPSDVASLVLLCPSGIAPQKGSFLLLAMALLPFGEWGRERLIRIVNGKDKVHEEAIRYTRLIADHFNPRVEAIPLFSDAELKRLEMPVLLIAGEKDALLPSKKTAERLEKLLPEATIEILPDRGHVLIGFHERILDFLLMDKTSCP